MPFSNASNDEDSGYLVDGIVEDLITEFSMIRELELVSRQSCFDFGITIWILKHSAKSLELIMLL